MFERATITLGIGPHFSSFCLVPCGRLSCLLVSFSYMIVSTDAGYERPPLKDTAAELCQRLSSVQDTGHAPAHSHRTRRTAGLVFKARCASLLRPAR